MTPRSLLDMARCLRVARALQRYLDGQTAGTTTERIAEHLEQCRRCGLQADTYRAIKKSLRAGPDAAVDPDALARLREFSATPAPSNHNDTR
jgi:anti-sigma factor RsiW